MNVLRQLIAIIFLCLLALFLVGLPSATEMSGHPMSDLYDHVWGYGWFAHSLMQGKLPLYTDISHGEGGSLWFVDPVGALLSLPFQAVFSLPVAVGATLWLQLSLGLGAAYALGWDRFRDQGAALVVAVCYAGGGYGLSIIHSGTLEYLCLAPLPLFWLGVERRQPGLSAVAWAWATLGSFYYGAFIGILFLSTLGDRSFAWKILRYALLPNLLIGIVAGLTLNRADAVIHAESAPGWNYSSLPLTDLWTFIAPDYHFPDLARMGNQGIVHANPLPWLASIAALWAVWKGRQIPDQRRWSLLLGACLLLALGPGLCVAGWIPKIAGYTLPLPTALFYLPGSPLRFIHHPYRLVVLPLLFIGLLAGQAVRGRPAWAAGLVVASILQTLFLSPAPWPIPKADAQVPEIYQNLQGGILDFPPEFHQMNRLYTYYQTLHWQRIPYGVNVYVPESLRQNGLFLGWMGCLNDHGARGVSRDGGPPVWNGRPPKGMVVNADRVRVGKEELLSQGYAWVILHEAALQSAELRCLTGRLGAAVAAQGGLSRYALAAAIETVP